MAGLLAARALWGHAQQVLVLERDRVPDGPQPRKGVPQGRHVHVLLEAGCGVLERCFPGIVAEMQREGLDVIDFGRDLAWHHFGVWKVRCETGMRMLLCTRPFLEHHVRARLLALPHVTLQDQTTVRALQWSADGSAVTGVVLDDGTARPADVVIDATGRGSKVPTWLEAQGYERPEDEEIGVDLSYTTCLYRPSPRHAGQWRFLVEYPSSANDWRGGFISRVEGDRWIVSLNGYFKDAPEPTHEGLLRYAKTLPRPDLYESMVDAEPLSEVSVHKIPKNRWRHYERLSRFPEGLVPLGDSVCALNPIFGQGMSSAGLQAEVLERALTEHLGSGAVGARGLEARVRTQVPSVLRLPWLLTSALDLHYPQASGTRPFGHGVLMWYVQSLLELCSTDARAYRRLVQVLSLEKGLTEILAPRVAAAVVAHGLRGLVVPLHARANTDRLPEAEERADPGA